MRNLILFFAVNFPLAWVLLEFCFSFQHGYKAISIYLIPFIFLEYLIFHLCGLFVLLQCEEMEIHKKLKWLVFMLYIPGIAGMLYFFFGPNYRRPLGRKPKVGDSD